MRILFVHEQLGTGGIETLILRWCRELRQQGHTPIVAVRTEGKGSLAPQVRRYADIAYLRHLTIPLLTGFRVGVNSFRAYTRSGVDVVYCMDPSMLLVATQLAARCPGAKLVAGVYHPAAYCFRGNLLTPEQELTRDLFHSLPVENVFFMNEAVRAAHERFLARDFQRSTIVPLAVDVDRFLQLKRQPSRHRVVSVGRLVDFKCYTFPTIDVVLSLNAEGHDFVYDIYGSGPERSRLERYVKARGAATVVKLHGAVPYEALESAFVEAFAFVGMGTALVESAASGVPSLVAIESNTAASTTNSSPTATRPSSTISR
jgi:glycosyltransferase involved in cell wall biosynthesis